MDDLEAQIAEWRRSLNDLPSSEIERRESALREQVAALQQEGVDARKAFAIVSSRGGPVPLHPVDGESGLAAWPWRLRWMVLGFLTCFLAERIIGAVTNLLGVVLIYDAFHVSTVIIARLLTAAFLLSVLVVGAVWLLRRRPGSLIWLSSWGVLGIGIVIAPLLTIVLNVLVSQVAAVNLMPDAIRSWAMTRGLTELACTAAIPLALVLAALWLRRIDGDRIPADLPRGE